MDSHVPPFFRKGSPNLQDLTTVSVPSSCVGPTAQILVRLLEVSSYCKMSLFEIYGDLCTYSSPPELNGLQNVPTLFKRSQEMRGLLGDSYFSVFWASKACDFDASLIIVTLSTKLMELSHRGFGTFLQQSSNLSILCSGFVTGTQGNFLRTCEEDQTTLQLLKDLGQF